MLKNLLRKYDHRVVTVVRRYTTNHLTTVDKELEQENYQVIDTRALPNCDIIDYKSKESSPIEECKEDISHVAPYLKPTFNFAAYVNKSTTLQQLVHLGVDLHKLEKNTEVPPYILGLDFEKDIKGHVRYLHDIGLETEDIASLITKNPFIIKEDIDILEVRVNYLKSKKFDDLMITRVIQKNPHWLSYSTQDIDKKLGFFQKTFALTGDQIRLLTVRNPRLITYNEKHVKLIQFVAKEEMGFTPEEIQKILLDTPKLFLKNQLFILKTFEYVHKQMNLSLEIIAEMPSILTCREFRVKQRHLFLQKMGRDQFDPKKTQYVSPLTMVSGTDSHFATEVACSSIQAFNTFLKSL